MDLMFSQSRSSFRELPACIQLMPLIKRAREYHLYDYSGKRYLDLYLNGGYCLLGHRPQGVFGVLKNTLSKGCVAEYPSLEYTRFMRHLATVFPLYKEIRIYRNPDRARRAIGDFLEDPEFSIYDPLVDEKPGRVQLWRPFAPSGNEIPDIIVPIIPFPSRSAPVVVCFRGGEPPQSDTAPPYLLAALSRALGGISGFSKVYNEEVWNTFPDTAFWERKGPYLVFGAKEEEYRRLFELLLKEGIIIPPYLPAVGIIPANFTAGEIAPIMKAEDKWRV